MEAGGGGQSIDIIEVNLKISKAFYTREVVHREKRVNNLRLEPKAEETPLDAAVLVTWMWFRLTEMFRTYSKFIEAVNLFFNSPRPYIYFFRRDLRRDIKSFHTVLFTNYKT